MLLKFVMPYVDRLVRGGSIIKWYKTEGDSVAYGDDLLDLAVNVTERPFIGLAAADGESPIDGGKGNTRPMMHAAIVESYSIRITASEAGIMRKIYAREGMRREIGELLGLLTTDDEEPIPDEPAAASGASVFRVVTNIVQPS